MWCLYTRTSKQIKINFNIKWQQGVTLKFVSGPQMKDQYIELQRGLVHQLIQRDFLAFVQFFNEIDRMIDESFVNILKMPNEVCGEWSTAAHVFCFPLFVLL